MFYAYKGDGKLALEHLHKSIRCLEEKRFPYVLGWAWSFLGFGYYLLGDLNTARRNIEKGINISSKTGVTILSPLYRMLSFVFHDSGDFKNAQKHAEKALKLSQKYKQMLNEGSSKILLGRIKGKADISQFDEAEKSILQGIKILDERQYQPGTNRTPH